jgi:hypothetical protein
LLQHYKFDIGILGNLVGFSSNHWSHPSLTRAFQLMHLQGVNVTPYFMDRLWLDRMPDLLAHMQAYNLIIDVNVDALPTDNLTSTLHKIIQQHFDVHHLYFPPQQDRHVAPSTESVLDAVTFHSLPWKLVKMGYQKTYPNTGTYDVIGLSALPYESMTWNEFFSNKKGTRGPEHRRAPNLTEMPLLWIGKVKLVRLDLWLILF